MISPKQERKIPEITEIPEVFPARKSFIMTFRDSRLDWDPSKIFLTVYWRGVS
jgi:hypothetical protein